jgi:hypothetical protein
MRAAAALGHSSFNSGFNSGVISDGLAPYQLKRPGIGDCLFS